LREFAAAAAGVERKADAGIAVAAPDAAKGDENGQVPATRQQGSAQAEHGEAGRRGADPAFRRQEPVGRGQPAEAQGLKPAQGRMRIAPQPPTVRRPVRLSAFDEPDPMFVVNADASAAGFAADPEGAADASPPK